MQGLFALFSIWQGFINLTVARPPQFEAPPWPPRLRGFPPRPSTAASRAAERPPYNHTLLYTPEQQPNGWTRIPLITIADQDKLSASKTVKGLFVAPSVRGHLRYNLNTMEFEIEWESVFNYTSFLNNKGRGMELSDLKVFNGHLYAPDDKTSIVFRLTDQMAIPWTVEADGNGFNNRTYKTEWLAIKDEELYVGGYGKEYTDKHGRLLNKGPMWIKIIDRFGAVRHVNWTRQFHAVRSSIGIEFPAYMVHESCQWSEVHKSWFFLPRRASWTIYKAAEDENKGTNYLIKTDESFTEFSVVRIGQDTHPTHGFSAFQFVPGSHDRVIIALKSEEVEGQPLASYVMIFDVDGRVYMEETKIQGDFKLEGLEFVDWTRPF
ncbi:Soluble calcium-activated nucleotidase 1-like protein [Aphelenchoides fujianensis]|nr:Soluble calcium-activated nucleotidase 1-like protein [Aphelenchoides fujianensis]